MPLSTSFPLGESSIIGNFIFNFSSIADIYPNLKANANLCNTAPVNDFKSDVNISPLKISPIPNSIAYLSTLFATFTIYLFPFLVMFFICFLKTNLCFSSFEICLLIAI